MQDATLKFYVLTSRNLKCVKRQFHTIPKEHTTVIINTLDDNYASECYAWCKTNGVDVEITESNGMPGKGKNSVLDHFGTTNYKFMLLIDGDDFVQPHGVNYYTAISNRADAPDGIQIVWSKSWSNGKNPGKELFAPFPWLDDFKAWAQRKSKCYPFLKQHLQRQWKNRFELEFQFNIHQKQNETWNYPPDSMHFMDCARLIFWSQKLSKSIRFREDLMIGEDSLLNYEVRDMAYKREVVLEKIKDNQEKTYYYDLTNSGIVRRLQNKVDWEWLVPLNEAIAAREPYWTVPHHFSLAVAVLPYDIGRAPPLKLQDL